MNVFQILAQAAPATDSSFWGAVIQSTAAVGMAILFLWYLRYLEERRSEDLQKRQEALKHINDDCHDHSKQITEVMAKALDKSDKVIQENTRVLGETNARLSDVKHEIAEFRETVSGLGAIQHRDS